LISVIVEFVLSRNTVVTACQIFEFGEIDLSRLLQRSNGKSVSENYLRMYWQQMLEAVQTIHEVSL
jgi:hypothetical protein